MKGQRCKGTWDLLPPDMRRFRHIEEVFRTSCLGWGYEEVRTPVLEYLYLFTSAGTLTPAMLSRVYSFLDWDGWSGERVVLRPDGTIPAARLFLNELAGKKTARLFYVEDVFSFEETGTEARERWQCGVELMGGSPPVADVELVLLAQEVLRGLGLEGVEVRLAHTGLLRALLDALGLGVEEQAELLDQILDGNTRALEGIKPSDGELQRAVSLLFELKGESPGFLKNLRALLIPHLPGLASSLDDFLQIAELLTALGCDYQIDMTSGKGFEYYTGVVFQFYMGGEKVGGGGRYDHLIPLLGGEEVPASGLALYMEPLMRLISPRAQQPQTQRVLVTVEPGGEWKLGFQMMQELRAAGYGVELELDRGESTDFRWRVLIPGEKGGRLVLTEPESE
ncbi:MAG: ATP phosphoribosyltransferase regulatory subunit, partial [Dehalococcoidia bacterium]